MREHFLSALARLNAMLGKMSAKTESTVGAAVRAVYESDVATAELIITQDREIDLAEVEIEEECLKIFALYQPVAVDLRHLVTILKVNNEMERVGDLAVNIADCVIHLAGYPEKTIRVDVEEMAEKVCKMLRDALDSLMSHDAKAARDVMDSDDAVDLIHRQNYERVKRILVDAPEMCGYYMNFLTVSRCLERVGDIATNIAEDVIYQETGKIVRHRDVEGTPEEKECRKF